LDITVVLCNNQRYAILEVELLRAGIEVPGPKAASLTSLADPALDFTSIANGMGVPATRATTADEFAIAYTRANSEPGPHLIEAML
ncbi:MAG: acetolactate synthase large subunit, partial [Actinomycetia bacterium]|nr:acetolactate synthase large subunit [Actinomycetes bacterium]